MAAANATMVWRSPSRGFRQADRDGALEIQLRGGYVIRVAAGFDEEHLRRVVTALEA